MERKKSLQKRSSTVSQIISTAVTWTCHRHRSTDSLQDRGWEVAVVQCEGKKRLPLNDYVHITNPLQWANHLMLCRGLSPPQHTSKPRRLKYHNGQSVWLRRRGFVSYVSWKSATNKALFSMKWDPGSEGAIVLFPVCLNLLCCTLAPRNTVLTSDKQHLHEGLNFLPRGRWEQTHCNHFK